PRKPVVGEPPLSQARSAGVAKPRPKVLSRKAHRKVKPISRRTMPRRVKPHPFFSTPAAAAEADCEGTKDAAREGEAAVADMGDAFRWWSCGARGFSRYQKARRARRARGGTLVATFSL